MASIVKRLSGRFGKPADADIKQLKALSRKVYKEQAIWFLNAFWNRKDGSASPQFSANAEMAEVVWKYWQECAALDPHGEEGHEIDEMLAHRLLEKLETALTVVQMREVMRAVDVDFNKYVSLTEFLVYKFGVDWKVLVTSIKEQGEELKEILKEAEEAFQAAQAELQACQEKAAAAAAAEQHAVDEEAKAKAAEEEAYEKEKVFAEAEAKAQALEDEQRKEEEKLAAAVKELADEEKAHEDAVEKLSAMSKRNSIGIVKRGKASNELAQLRATETTGLRRARLNQEAALRRQQRVTKEAAAARVEAQRARKPFQEAREAAVAAREAAVEATAQAKVAREEADAAVESSVAAFKEAEDALDKVKAEFADAGQGQFWWLERELEEAKKFMSKKQLAALARAEASG